jgi:hypothetical protein
MGTTTKLNIFAAALLAVSFFLPWVMWKDAALSGNDMPAGEFFAAAKEKFIVGNPFPQFSFAFKIFWLIPAGAVLTIVLTFLKKNAFWLTIVAGLLSIALVLLYFLFSKSLVNQLGVSKSTWNLIKPWLFVQALAAVVTVVTAGDGKWLMKGCLLFVTVVGTIIGFNMVSKQAEKKIFEETFISTDDIKADYCLSVIDLLREFVLNDTAANKKYTEKMLQVTGTVSAVDIAADSTSTIRFEDSTGPYAIFSLEKSQVNKIRNTKAGDMVSVKGICSGSIFSDILGTTSINFKRSILNKQ